MNVSEENEEVFYLSTGHLQAIEEGIEDIKNENCLTNEEVRSYFEKWLNK